MKNVRLPAHVLPSRYRMLIHPDLKKFTFRGEETISLRLAKATSTITLHAKDLTISQVQYRSGAITLPARKIEYDPERETATFRFPRRLRPDQGELNLCFQGVLNDKLRGFYRSSYQTKDGEKHIATTQFEATDARRAFPCFDEPALKAVFDLTVLVPPGQTAISNTVPVQFSEHESGYQMVQFAPTPRMSTYLLAFIVGEFESVERRTRHGVLVRVFTTPGKKHQAQFALDVACRALSFYQDFFGIPYPLPVLDLVAIPDFEHGAMENWGAVTFRESALLVDAEHTSLQNKQWVAIVVVHELAHQWFGNLVTMEWWTELWLNESFARFMEYFVIDHLFPEWQIWTQFVFTAQGDALAVDGLAATQAVETKVWHPGEIDEAIDPAISYSKGACVIRMLVDYLGPKNFQNGLRHYLKCHSYRNAKTEDLWLALQEISGQPVRHLMQTWIKKPGYPLIRVQVAGRKLVLRQSRFFASETTKLARRDRTLWPVPIRYRFGPGRASREILLSYKKTIIRQQAKSSWLKLNAGEMGFFRVAYPPELQQQLQGAIQRQELNVADRLGVLRDAFALAESGDLPTTEALALVGAYHREKDYTVWLELAADLGQIWQLIAAETWAGNFAVLARGLFAPAAKRAGWSPWRGESHTETLLRELVIYQAGKYGDPGIIRQAQKLFQRSKRDARAIHPNLRAGVYRLVAENGGRSEHAELLRRYRAAELHEEQDRIGRALGAFRNPSLVRKSLKFALSRAVRVQDAPYIIASAWRNPYARDITWQFVRAEWRKIHARYGQIPSMLGRFIIAPCDGFASEARAREVKKFFTRHSVPGTTRAVARAVETIQSQAAWLQRDRSQIRAWLQSPARPH
ncbi:MAG: M1 family metallopeptidase [Candidatus Liptonbacteria bacterium]|nr:M1 family metallopeptidase [Candidatus Liptonbacteria bacterium]